MCLLLDTKAPFTQPVQGGNAVLLFHFAVLYKRYGHEGGGQNCSTNKPATEEVTDVCVKGTADTAEQGADAVVLHATPLNPERRHAM